MTTLLTDLQSGVLTLTLNRPPVNAFNLEMVTALRAAFTKAVHDTNVRCIILTGTGKAFSAGHDVAEMLQVQSQGGEFSYRAHMQATYNPLVLQIRQIEKPVIAAVNGAAAGAGLGIALACDLRIAAEAARFAVGFTGIGLTMDSGVSLLLPALIGLGRATEAAFTNTPVTAEQALAWGLVNRLVPAAGLASEASKLAASLAAGTVGAFGLTKRAFNRAILPNLEAVLDYEAHLQEIACKGEEHRQGVAAFLEKRPPKAATSYP